jgi:hypothetical protein
MIWVIIGTVIGEIILGAAFIASVIAFFHAKAVLRVTEDVRGPD